MGVIRVLVFAFISALACVGAKAAPLTIIAPSEVTLGSIALFNVEYTFDWDKPVPQNDNLTDVPSRVEFRDLKVLIDGIEVAVVDSPSTLFSNPAFPNIGLVGSAKSALDWTYEHTFSEVGTYDVSFEGFAYYWRDLVNVDFNGGGYSGAGADEFSGLATVQVTDSRATVPSPATLALLIVGLTALGYARRGVKCI